MTSRHITVQATSELPIVYIRALPLLPKPARQVPWSIVEEFDDERSARARHVADSDGEAVFVQSG